MKNLMRFNLKFLGAILFALVFLVGGFIVTNKILAAALTYSSIPSGNLTASVPANFIVQAPDSSGYTVTLSDGSAGGIFYGGTIEGGCSDQLSGSTITIASTTTHKAFCYSNATPGIYPITTSADSLDSVSTSVTVQGATIVGGATYGTIQAAINGAVDGNTINVGAGTYAEHVTIGKSISLIGADKATTFVDGGGTGTVVTITANNVTVKNFTVKNSGTDIYENGGTDGGILAQSVTGSTIENNIFTNDLNSVLLLASSNNTVKDNTITGSARYGIVMDFYPLEAPACGTTSGTPSTLNTISGNTITASGRDGIYVGGTSNTNTITNNAISGTIGISEPICENDFEADGLYLWNSSNNMVTGNTISNNATNGIEISKANENTITGNTITGNLTNGLSIRRTTGSQSLNNVVNENNISGNIGYGLSTNIYVSDPAIDATSNWWGNVTGPNNATTNPSGTGNAVSDNVDYSPWWGANYLTGVAPNITQVAHPWTWYLNNSNSSTIQEGITAATAGDTINVGEGIYNEHDITINKSLTLTGNVGDASAGPGANAPIVDGQNQWHYGFKLANGVSNVTIQGFEIRNYVGTDGDGDAIMAWVASTNHITVNDNYMHNLSSNGVLVGNDGAIGDHSYWTIARNKLSDFGPDSFSTSGYGLELSNTSHGIIEDNVIDSGTSNFPGTGILIYNRRASNHDILIQRNSIHGQFDFAGINVQSSTEEVSTSNLDDVRILNNDVDISGASSALGIAPAIRIRNKIAGTVTGVVIHDNKLINTSGYGVTNNTTATLNATNNWWGSEVESIIQSKISDNVDYSPWYTNVGKTTLSNSTVLPDESGNATVTNTNKEVVVTATTPVTIDLGSVVGATINFDSLIDNSTGSGIIPQTTISSGIATVEIPADTTVTALGWNGIMSAPTTGSTSGTAPAGFSVGSTVIEMGSPDHTLNFSNAVKIILTGVTGTVGYRPAGSTIWQTITTKCTSATVPGISSGECYFTEGGNTVIWTYHFTTFGGLDAVRRSGGGSYIVRAIPATPAVPGVSPATPATPVAKGKVLGAASFNFTILVKNGSRGNEIIELQKFLTSLGYDCGTADGKFGPKTKGAVIKFQKANKLVGDGVVGAKTRAVLNK